MSATSPLQLWGGVECTVNRVGDIWFDQMARNGHDRRIDDLDRFAGLGLRTIRQPFLWEKIVPGGLVSDDWQWAEARLERLNGLGIHPVAGLMHHGSGPIGTDLIDPAFPELFAGYAGNFASRFPQVMDYTPINEPVTTARFSGLYGLWYPHGSSDHAFLKILFNQCKATILSMARIRQFQPAARLIQTEDIGFITGTAIVATQAEFENQRRWLSLDLLCGRVTPDHSLWGYLRASGCTKEEILWFAKNPCPPGIIGVNHHVSSNRHLDDRWEKFPIHCRGGNGVLLYADTEAVRVRDSQNPPLRDILMEVWRRYHIPLVVTEAHLTCTREEQMRWLQDVWNNARAARSQGADVQAVTAWGLLGLHDWHCLVTRKDNCYESGVYDVRSGSPRPTALAGQVRSLAVKGSFHHPLLEIPGWWRRDIRFLYPAVDAGNTSRAAPTYQWEPGGTPPLLIVGGGGGLGEAFARVCGVRAIPWLLLSNAQFDARESSSVRHVLDTAKPWGAVYANGYVRDGVSGGMANPGEWNLPNGSSVVSAECNRRNIPYLCFSPDFVFDGKAATPYHEASPPTPPDPYSQAIVRAERTILETNPRALVVRTGSLFGPWDADNFLTTYLNRLRLGRNVRVNDHATISVTYIPDMVNASLDLLVDEAQGIWHLANRGETCQEEILRRTAEAARLDAHRVISRSLRRGAGEDNNCPAGYRVLGSIRGGLLPPLEEAADRYLRESIAFA